MPPLSASLVARIGVVADPRWSPDGRRLGWVRGAGGRSDLVVVDGSDALGGVDRAPTVVTAATGAAHARSTGGGVWCWVGEDHVAVVDPDGRLLLVPVDGGAPRPLSDAGRAAAPAATDDGSRVAYVLERDDSCDVVVAGVGSDGPGRRVSDADFAWDPSWSPDGTRLAWHEWDLAAMSWDSSRIVLRDDDGSSRVVAGGAGVSVGQPRFSRAGDALAWVSDESGWWNVVVADAHGDGARPVLPEPFEQAEPAWGVGQRSFAWSPDGRQLALCRNEAGFGRLVVAPVDPSPRAATTGAATTEAAQEVARGWHHGLDWGPAGIVAVRSGARTPPELCITRIASEQADDSIEPSSSRRDVVARAAPPDLDRADLVEPEPVTWPADDGTTLHGQLFRPQAPAGGAAPPMVVDVHGGPTGQATVQWKPMHQHLVANGFAVLAPDPRGSTGHGRAFAQALAGGWGDVDVADCAAGIRAAIERGWCDPRRVVVSGASSGGLTALLLAAEHPELVRAVIATYAVTDLARLAATTHRFESRSTDWLVGELPEHEARYRERSPITHAASIRAPVLLLHGSADTVVPAEQAVELADAIREAGGDVEHHEYPEEGHGWARPDTLLDVYERIDDFLRRKAGQA
jgi:dipeptidyl aminopeptidase/acylaminoacyl peptidase